MNWYIWSALLLVIVGGIVVGLGKPEPEYTTADLRREIDEFLEERPRDANTPHGRRHDDTR